MTKIKRFTDGNGSAYIRIKPGTKKVNHTPGPWKFNGEHMKSDSSAVIRSADNMTVAFAADFNKYARDEEKDANARLIASAPELLDAVKRAYSLTAPLSAYGRELEALIAKAEGK